MFLLLNPFVNNSRKKEAKPIHSISRKLSFAEGHVNRIIKSFQYIQMPRHKTSNTSTNSI